MLGKVFLVLEKEFASCGEKERKRFLSTFRKCWRSQKYEYAHASLSKKTKRCDWHSFDERLCSRLFPLLSRPSSSSHNLLFRLIRRQRRIRRNLITLAARILFELLCTLPRKRRFWSLHATDESQRGFWETEVMIHWRGIN